MNYRIEKRRIVFIAIILYFLLLFDSGFYFVAKGGYVLIAQVFLSISLLLICKVTLYKTPFLAFYLFFMLVVFGALFSGDSIRNCIVSILELFSGLCIAYSFVGKRKKEVGCAFRIVMLFICIGSLIAFALTSVKSGVIAKLPIFVSSNKVETYFWGLSFSYVPSEYYIARNLGLFWEPGAFQVYIILALIYELFIYSRGGVLPRVVYTITILTTMSSTGIVCMLIIWILYSLSVGDKVKGITLFIALISGCLFIYFRRDILPTSIRFNLFDKIQSVFNGNSQEFVTVTTRVNSIVYGLELILSKPLFGIGRGLDELRMVSGNNIVSCTPINWMLQYGILFGSVAYIGLYGFVRRVCSSRTIRLVMYCTLLLLVATEAFNISPTFFCIVYIGFMTNKSNTIV